MQSILISARGRGCSENHGCLTWSPCPILFWIRHSASPPSLQVKVILGEDREATGVLLSIDGEDGIVRMDLEEQLKILNLRFLGKLLEA